MAHGWDAYFHNLPPLSSEPSTLTRTSESQGSLPLHIENFIGQHDFPSTEASHEASAANSNFNTNYYSNPSIENPSSDCLYPRYDNETPWQADGEQIGKDNLPRCGSNEITDFATDGLSTLGSFPSSFATDLQELKQDCGMLATSFLEDYSDVSSCSDADVGETRPSCKFMAGKSVPKSKTDVTTKPSSSEWLFTDSGNMMVPTASCPNMSETNVALPSTSNVMAGENIVKDQIECPAKTVKSYRGHNQALTTSNMVKTTGSKTVQESEDNGGCTDRKQKEDVEKDLIQGRNSHISISGNEKLTDDGIQYPDSNEEKKQIAIVVPNSMTTLNNAQDLSGEEVLRKEIEESFNQKNGNPNATKDQDGNMQEDKQDTSKVLKREGRELSSLRKETFAEQTSPNANSNDGRNDIMETNGQKKETDQQCIKLSDSTDATERGECTSTLKSNNRDVESCLHLPVHQIYKCLSKNNICLRPAVMSDGHSSNASDKNGQCVGNNLDTCLQSTSSSTNVNHCLEKERTSSKENINTNSPDPDVGVPGFTSLPIDTSDKKRQGVANNVETCLQPNHLSTDTYPGLEMEWTSTPEKRTPTSSAPDCSDTALIGDSKEQRVSNGLPSCSQSNTLSTGTTTCVERELTSPADNTNVTSCPDQQQPQHQSPVELEQGSLNADVTENAAELFKESAEESSLSGILYGEPLSREDSSSDTDEIQLDKSPYKDTSVAKPDSNGMNYPERQAPQLKSSIQMRKQLQPVVILKTPESVNEASNTYHCANCQHTTHNVDHLIEHHHCCHSMQNFQFCMACNVYLMTDEQSQKHVCCVTKDGPQLSSDSSRPKKKKRFGKHRCVKCKLIFSKLTHYVTHIRSHTGKTPYKCNVCGSYFAQSSSMRRHKQIPGRCKGSKLQVTNSDANSDIKETKTPLQKDHVQNKSYPNLPECYVKLVDISKTHLCSLCGKNFSTLDKVKKHVYNVHKGKGLAVSSSQCTTKHSGEKTPKVESGARGIYKCPLCPRLFKYSYNRARHLRDCVRNAICNGKENICGKYRCPLCHVTFTLSSNRYRHIKAICLRECVNRLAKERATSKEQVETKKTKEIELKKEPMEMEQKKQTPQASTALKAVPRYKCTLCPAVFCYTSGKYRHMKKHEAFKLTGKMFKYRNSVFSTLPKPETLSSTNTEETKDNSKSTETTGSLALSCKFCGRCFDTPQSLKKHVRSHKGEKPYLCLECGKGFKKRAYLIGHKSVHQRRIQCTVCRKILPTVGELIQHRSSHLKRGMLRCPDCDLQFQYPAHLLRHLDAHKKRENRKNRLGERPSLKPQESSLESVKDQSGPKQLQCSLCKEVFNDAQVLRKHCLTHISVSSSNQCPFCKDDFPNRRYLLRHMIKHTGDKPFSCTNCGRQFYRDLYLKLHIEKCLPAPTRHLVPIESDVKMGPHLCFYCPRAFFKKNRLKNHHRGHKANSLLLCSRCGQYFGFTKLSQHQRNCTETSELNNGLSVNGNVCNSNSQTSPAVCIMPPKSNATELLPFKCTHCKKRFRYRSLILRHLVSHTGVKPYACMHCRHRYGTRTMCLQHEAFCDGVYKEGPLKVKDAAATQLSKMPTHSEAAQTPKADDKAELKCKFCTKTFMKSRSLRRHILTHNEVKPYRCKACDSCYSRYDHLKVHQIRCKGKKTRLEVCIPKISLEDLGKGWKNRIGMLAAAEKQETIECKVCSRSFSTQSKLSRHVTMFHITKLFKCTHCGSSFAHERSLKKHRKIKKCRTRSKERNALLQLEANPPTENVTNPLKVMRNRIIQRIQPYLNKKYKYTCSYCPRAFQNTWQLSVHTRLHTGERPYACDDCGQRFIRKDYVKRHSVRCTKKRCIVTPRLSKSTVCQSQQSTNRSPPKGFSCAYCSSRFLLFSQLQEHFLNAHKLETKASPISSAPLQHHLSNIPNIKKEPLDESCDKRCGEDAKLISELDAAPDSKVPNPLSCPVCNVSFTNKAGLNGHLRVHTMELPFNCKTCKRGFWNKKLLHNHNRKCRYGYISEKSTTQQLEVPLKAEIDFVLNDSVLVFKEASESSGTGVLQTNFSCKGDLMDTSTDNSKGKSVQSSSSNEKKAVPQYQCSECDKSFTDGLMLISHLEEHGRQEQAKKRIACIKCGFECSNRGHLARHMKVHATNEKHSCPDCSTVVKTLSDLEIHRTCHDPNRPFTCKLCNHKFWTNPSLCNHYRETHPDDVFNCRFCYKTYSVKKSLGRHYRMSHQQEQRNPARTVKEKSIAEQQSSSRVSTAAESHEDKNTGSEDNDSDSAPYFPCHVCGKTFPTSESLEDHQRCHLGDKPHECAECGRCFFQASQLQQHQRMHKSEFQCQACGRGFVSLFALRKHKHTHGKSRPHRCSKCDFSFTGPLQLAEHMLSIHREENFPCDICNLVFLSKSSRVEHRKSHSKSSDGPSPPFSRTEREMSASLSEGSSVSPKELKYRCGVCGERFRDPEELSEHGCIEAKERPYSCSDCRQHFLHASHLKKHRTSHHTSWSNSDYLCNQCNNTFSTAQSFLSHLKSHNDTAAEIKPNTEGAGGDRFHNLICPVCHQCFASATELICHFPTHSDGTFECNICKKTFPSKSTLEEHERHHVTSATEFECTECGQRFWGKDAFKQHHCSHHKRASKEAEYSKPSAKTSTPTYYQAGEEEEIDVTGEDLYNCQVCSIKFSSKSGLLEHQNLLHRNEKLFKCELCEKTFARRRYLREHQRRHSQKATAQSVENEFTCTQCHTKLNTAQDLSLHMRLHAEKEVGAFRCDMCYKSFSQWSHLKQHQESHVGQIVYECTECDKAFAFPHLLEEHQQTHAGSSR
ncbi:zinc finger protein 1035 isoform X2 [Cyclopterus lumpus]|uniref:zinc finger protein 1035 isoform X2 n=1 Tax=Cyclopterus lumpus TaxID=8103 RepID=UPI001486B27B|nr:zinc finger protein 1035 isoform X2 [Cyclopterus lumpus]